MKAKKYISVLSSIALIWLLIALSEKITSDIYSVIMYIAFGLILIALFAYQIKLRLSVTNSLLNEMNPQKFLKDYQELDGNKYSNPRYILEALAYILLGDFIKAENLLKNVKNKKDDLLTADALLVLCYYFSENNACTQAAISTLKTEIGTQTEKNERFLYFTMLIETLISDKSIDSQILEKYFNSITKKNFAEVYIANYILGETKLKLGDTENALILFENIAKSNCDKTILYNNAVVKINSIKQ